MAATFHVCIETTSLNFSRVSLRLSDQAKSIDGETIENCKIYIMYLIQEM